MFLLNTLKNTNYCGHRKLYQSVFVGINKIFVKTTNVVKSIFPPKMITFTNNKNNNNNNNNYNNNYSGDNKGENVSH